jgi:SAM-dependent methyltransferase
MQDPLGYDELPYPSAPYPYSHCDHLAMVARLFGIDAADARQCRVLEVGCADGANLIPMALTLPASRFVGIDLSERQVSAGNQIVSTLGLSNIQLVRQDLSDFASDGATFDYVIAHGVLSWTSRDVQTRLLNLIRSSLAPQGIAFVSYNVYPGWQQQKALREWLLQATCHIADTPRRLQEVRRLMHELRRLVDPSSRPREQEIAHMLGVLESWTAGYLRHDLLEENNEPFFFSDFVERIRAHGLRFLAEADVASMAGTDLPRELANASQRLGGSLVGREQLIDLLANRMFRQSLLCLSECPAREQLDDSAVRSAYIVSTLRRAHKEQSRSSDNSPDLPMRFESRAGFAIDIDDSMVAGALERLQHLWPGGAWFDQLIPSSANSLEGEIVDAAEASDHAAQRQMLATVLLAAFVERAVELHSIAPAAATAVGERPVASPLARLQAQSGHLVTNLRHDLVSLEPPARALIRHLDGTHDRSALEQLAAANPAQRPHLDELLTFLLRAGLLMPDRLTA